MPGKSWTREMRPMPIAPILMRLLGAFCSKTLAGTMVGKPAAAAAVMAVFKNSLRGGFALRRCLLMDLASLFELNPHDWFYPPREDQALPKPRMSTLWRSFAPSALAQPPRTLVPDSAQCAFDSQCPRQTVVRT